MLGLAALAAVIGLAAIIGAFLAGMVVGESERAPRARDRDRAGGRLLHAVLLRVRGGAGGPRRVRQPRHDRAAGGNHRAGGRRQVRGAFLGALPLGRARAALVAWGMVPRGEVEIIVAGLALTAGAIGTDLYAVIVAMVVITGRGRAAADGAAGAARGTRAAPPRRPRQPAAVGNEEAPRGRGASHRSRLRADRPIGLLAAGRDLDHRCFPLVPVPVSSLGDPVQGRLARGRVRNAARRLRGEDPAAVGAIWTVWFQERRVQRADAVRRRPDRAG